MPIIDTTTHAVRFFRVAFHLQSIVLDDLDRDLLRELQRDARQSYRTLAAALGSTVPTVSARIRRMEDIGVIRGYRVDVDPERFGASAGPASAVDVDAPAAVVCHTCDRPTTDPVWWRGDGRHHPFCCPTCRTDMVRRYEAAKGL